MHWTITKKDGSKITGTKADLMAYSVIIPVGLTFSFGLIAMSGLSVVLCYKTMTKR